MVTTWTNLKDPAKLKKPDTKGQILCDFTYMRYLRQSICRDRKQNSGCQELREGGVWEFLFNGDRVPVQKDEILKMNGSDG